MINIRQETCLFPYNTFGVPATASVFVESDNASELVDFIRSLPDPSAFVLLGGGSNMLFVSERCDMVIRPVMKGVEIINETNDYVSVRAAAGEVWDDFVNWCVERRYAGVENLSHIPGTVGACPIQNIGAYGAEAKDTIEAVEAIEIATGQTVTFNKQQCLFDYRDSIFKRNKGKYIITYVLFKLSKKFVPSVKYSDLQLELGDNVHVNIENVRRAIINIRSRKLPEPTELGNAGSFFKNPTINNEKADELRQIDPQTPMYPVSDEYRKISAAWLVQQSVGKGLREGNVGIHKQQSLVIVNYGGATGREIFDFARKISNSVKDKFDIELEMEVNIV